ncbi:MAG: energy transducer TonB [Prevotella sp.]
MEVKKNKNVDLENGRFRMFMISIIVVLASFFVVLEYSSDETGDDDDDYDELMEDIELAPLKRDNDRIALALKQEPKPAAERIKVIEKTDELNCMDMPEEKREESDGNNDENGGEQQKEEEKDPMFAPAENALDDNPLNFRVVEDLPQFPGGAVEMMKWLTKNLKYPTFAQKRKIEGMVMVQFIVADDGSMTDLKVVKSLEKTCDNEALRVMRMMPKWKPGIQNGMPCRTMVCIPIVFKL